MAKKSNQQQEEIRRAIEIARAHGYVSVNDQEHELIKLLRYTTYHGRNLVMETAIAMRCAHPWRRRRPQARHPVNQRVHHGTPTSFGALNSMGLSLGPSFPAMSNSSNSPR